MDLNESLQNIESKVERLSTEIRRLRRENVSLAMENENLKSAAAKSDEMVVDLKRQLEKAQLALDRKQEDDPEYSIRLRKQIDKHIEELNKCIEWLEKV